MQKYSRLSSAAVVIGALRVEVLVIKDLFYVMDKALSGKLSCMWIDLV